MKDEYDVKIGAYIREKRKEKHLTMKELGRLVGSSEQAIYLYESGKRGMSLATFFKISRTLGFDPNVAKEFL